MSVAQFIQVVVGGLPYSVAVSDIERYPGSFFECMIKKEWLKDEKPITIDRDGALFKYVYSFLVSGGLPRNEVGKIALDEETLVELKQEADFFGIEALSKECDIEVKQNKSDLEGFITIRKYLNGRQANGFSDIDYSSALVRSLKEVWSPFCLTGKLDPTSTNGLKSPLFKSSTFSNLNLDELTSAAAQSAFGKGTETITDTSVRNSFEIPASELNEKTLKYLLNTFGISFLAPHLTLELRPYKLVIYKEGGHFDAHRDTVRGEGHIGTLVAILNSDYTGGELEVSHDGRTETVTGAYSWVAMYGDCLHKINPVTSGTRVSLIYDIYGTPLKAEDEQEEEEDEEEDEDGESLEDVFWDNQNGRSAKASSNTVRPVSDTAKSSIIAALDVEFQTVDSLVLTLQHLYPECQTSPAFLKGGDRALYDLLSEQYDVTVVAATIYRTHDPENRDCNETKFSLFSPALIRNGLGRPRASVKEKKAVEENEEEVPGKKRRTLSRTKLVITNQFDTDGLLDYTPYIEHTGNESQQEETVYIVAGLQVQKRAV